MPTTGLTVAEGDVAVASVADETEECHFYTDRKSQLACNEGHLASQIHGECLWRVPSIYRDCLCRA